MQCELLIPNIKYHGFLCDCYENQNGYFLLYKDKLTKQNLDTLNKLQFTEKEKNQFIKQINTKEYINIVV